MSYIVNINKNDLDLNFQITNKGENKIPMKVSFVNALRRVILTDIPIINVSEKKTQPELSELTKLLTEKLREKPPAGGIRNALQHMWGYVSTSSITFKKSFETLSMSRLLAEIRIRAFSDNVLYLIESTAISDLMLWIKK